MPTWSCRCRCTGGASCGGGFNQSAELARAVAGLAGKPFAPLAVTRVKVTRQQVGLGLSDREDNVRGAFRVLPEQDIDGARPPRAGGRRRLHDRRDRRGGGAGAEDEAARRASTC